MRLTNVRDIIKACDGAERISVESQKTGRPISTKGVYSWSRIGISDWHWPLVMKLSGVSAQDLLAANEALRRASPQTSKGRAVA